jgi:ribosomal subunit interface protein
MRRAQRSAVGTPAALWCDMNQPVRIAFHDVDRSDAIETYIEKRAEKLETYSTRLTQCRVTVESPHRHQKTGRHFRVAIDLAVPGAEIVVNNAQDDDQNNTDVYAAIDQAFEQAGRRLEEYVRRRRGAVKPHDTEYQDGRVAKLWAYEGYGFLESADGAEVYFHKNSVLNQAFDRLAVGSKVRFIEELGEKGPQASTVAVPGK